MTQLRTVLMFALLVVLATAAFAETAPAAPAATPEFLALIGAAPAGSGSCGAAQEDAAQIGVPKPQWKVCDPGVIPCTGNDASPCSACPGALCVKACEAGCCTCIGDC